MNPSQIVRQMATRKLSEIEKQHNILRKYIGKKAVSVEKYDEAIKKLKDLYPTLYTKKNIELGMHVRFLEDWTLDVTLADIQLWRNCTNKFFGLPFEKTNEGKRILTVLTSHEYCMEKYKRKWKEFLDYYHEAKQTIDYIKEYLPTTWEKLAKKDKIKKIIAIRKKTPTFDKYEYLSSYGINQIEKALKNKLDSLEMINLCRNNIYDETYKNLLVPFMTQSNLENEFFQNNFIEKLQNNFIKFFIKHNN